MRRMTVMIATLAILCSCASDPYAEERAAVRNGGYYWAAQRLEARAKSGDNDALAMLGALYYDNMGDRRRGLQMMTLSARRGSQLAQNYLSKIGQPIPSADLVQPRSGLVCLQSEFGFASCF